MLQVLLTWVHLLVAGHPIGINNALEAGSELVGANEGGRALRGGDPMHKGFHPRTSMVLQKGEEEQGQAGQFKSFKHPYKLTTS